MPVVDFGGYGMDGDATLEDLIEVVAKMQKSLDYLMQGGLDSKNMREVGGWLIGNTELQSRDKTVGMSTESTGADNIRFWAGDLKTGSPKFTVKESGTMLATDATITGGTLRTNVVGSDRIEKSGGKFRGITAAGSITGLYFDIGAVAGTGIAEQMQRLMDETDTSYSAILAM